MLGPHAKQLPETTLTVTLGLGRVLGQGFGGGGTHGQLLFSQHLLVVEDFSLRCCFSLLLFFFSPPQLCIILFIYLFLLLK